MKPTERIAKPASASKTGRFATPRAPWCGRLLATFLLALAVVAAAPLTGNALPAERHYEMVSPVYKGGYGVDALTAIAVEPGSETSNGVAFTSQGAFDGVLSTKYEFKYLARRGAAGWSTVPLEAPATLSPDGGTIDLSPDLRHSIFFGLLGTSTGAAQSEASQAGFFRHDLETPDLVEDWETFGVVERTRGSQAASLEALPIIPYGANLSQCHLVIGIFNPSISLLPQPEKAHEKLYDLRRAGAECGGEGYLRFIGLNNHGKFLSPSCGVELGGKEIAGTRQSTFNAISSNGEEIFFTAKLAPEGCRGGVEAQLYLRLAGNRTIEVSKPEGLKCTEVPCPGAESRAPSFFEGASEDGTKVFFTTTQPLAATDRDSGNDLYMATIGCLAANPGCSTEEQQVTALRQVSLSPLSGEAARVEHTVRVSPDGSRVYFVARGLLTAAANGLGQAALEGADNLYVDDVDTSETSFVTDLCSGPETSGEVADSHCPSTLEAGTGSRNDGELWEGGARVEAQSTRDGEFLVFSSYGQLTKGDTDEAKDVYRYDAKTGMLERVSLGEEGADGNGNGNKGAVDDATIRGAYVGGLTNYEQREAGVRAISEDGSRIVFESAEALSEAAINEKVNVYEWYEPAGAGEGHVSLISSGTSAAGDCCAVISPSGSDIFFRTNAQLVAQDTDEAADIYDARTGPGFPPAPVGHEECAGDSCQGPLSTPVPVLIAASSTQTPGENLAAPPTPKVAVKPKAKSKHAARKSNRKTKPKRQAHPRRGGRSAVADRRAR